MADPNPYNFGLYYLLVFLWVGLAHRRGTSLLMLPLLVVAYLVPLLLTIDVPQYVLSSVVYIVGVCALVGEVVGWVTERLSHLEAEVARTRGEARFRALVQHSADLTAIVDVDGIVRYASPSVQRILRRTPEEVVGHPIYAFLAASEIGRVTALVDSRIAATGAAEWAFVLPGGDTCHLETVVSNLLDNPDVQGIVLNCRDVTERKALEEQFAASRFPRWIDRPRQSRVIPATGIEHAQARARA